MTLYYAVGGGLGHLTRAQRVLRTLGIVDGIIVTSCDAPCDLPTIRVDENDSISAIIRDVDPDRVIVDAFPTGIRGELAGIRVRRIDYVARRLRWVHYRRACPAELHFDTTYLVEELEQVHLAWVEDHSRVVQPLILGVFHQRCEPGDFWLIVHSGPVDEVQDLIGYARDLAAARGESPRVLVATRCAVDLPEGFERTADVPYGRAARIISAAGFNVMLETEPWADKHHVVPFPRRFDDQFARASRRRKARCG